VNISPEASLLSVFLNASDRLHGKAAYQLVVETARSLHLAGASVFLVDFSFGAHRRIRDAKSDYLSFDIPVAVEIVDSPENVGIMISELPSSVADGFVVTRPVRVVHYAGHSFPDAHQENCVHADVTGAARESMRPTAMKIEGAAQRVTVYIGSSDTSHGRNLVTAIVEKCRKLGMAGATATHGTMGFGKASRIHRQSLLGLSQDLPVRIEIVDRPEQIAIILPVLSDLVQGGLIVLEDVHVVRYLHDPKGAC
jgi:PII-like signaling protein